MSVETDADGVTEGATVQESRDNMRQQCEMHGVVATTQRSVEGACVSGKEGFSIGSVSSLTEMSEYGWINYLLLSN